MSGTPGLPLPQWTRWLTDEFVPLKRLVGVAVEDAADANSRLAVLEARVEALENPPAQPEEPVEPPPDPEEPSEPQEPEEPVPGGLGDATHAVAPLVDEAFDAADPTVRTGRRMGEEERKYYTAFARAFYRSDPVAELNIVREFGRGDSYHLGRWGQTIQDPALQVLARAGDAGILDRLTVGWRLAYDDLVIPWDAGNLDETYIRDWAGAKVVDGKWVLKDGKTPWSPYPKWLYAGNNGRAGAGTDLNRLQTIKPWGILTEYLWALEANRGKASPAGIDYGAEADKWKPVLSGFIDTWSMDTDAPWARNYPGLDGGMLWGDNSTRAREGTWPIFVRGEGHAIYNATIFTFYCGLLGQRGWDIPNPAGAIAAADELVEYIRENLMVPSRDSQGRPCLILRGGAAHSAMSATYTGYAAMSLAAMRDIGRWNDTHLNDDTMTQIARAYDDMIRPDGSTMQNLAAEVDRSGTGLDVSKGSDRNPFQTAVYGCAYPLAWEDGDSLLGKALAAQATAGGLTDAKAHVLPAAMLVRSLT